MNLDEFKRNIEKWGKENNLITTIEVRDYWTEIFIQEKENESRFTIANINNNKTNAFDMSFLVTLNLDEKSRRDLMAIVIGYSDTDPDLRKWQKKYRLRHKWLGKNTSLIPVLHKEEDGIYLGTDNLYNAEPSKCKFTLKEVEELKEKLRTDLADFELVEFGE